MLILILHHTPHSSSATSPSAEGGLTMGTSTSGTYAVVGVLPLCPATAFAVSASIVTTSTFAASALLSVGTCFALSLSRNVAFPNMQVRKPFFLMSFSPSPFTQKQISTTSSRFFRPRTLHSLILASGFWNYNSFVICSVLHIHVLHLPQFIACYLFPFLGVLLAEDAGGASVSSIACAVDGDADSGVGELSVFVIMAAEFMAKNCHGSYYLQYITLFLGQWYIPRRPSTSTIRVV